MAPPDPAGRPPLNLWSFILPLGEGQPDGAARAVAQADEVDQLGLALTRPRFDEKTLRFAREFRQRVVDLDLGKLWSLFPATGTGKRRELPVVGRNLGSDGYLLTNFPTGREPTGRPLGRMNGRVVLEPVSLPVTRRDGYRAEGESRIGMGALTHRQIARSGESMLALTEQATHASLWQAIHEAFPRGAAFISRFLTVDASQVTIRHQPGVGSYLDYRATFRLKPAGFKGAHPDLYDYLQGLGDLFQFYGGVWNDSGKALLRFEVDSKKKELKVRFLTRDGSLLPFDSNGNPAGAGIRLSDPGERRFVFSLQGHVRKYGTTFDLKRYPLTVVWKADRSRAAFSTRIRQAPQIVVSQEVFYVVPKDWADFFLPGQIDQHSRDFFEAVAGGPDGEGTRIETEYRNGSGADDSLWQGQIRAAVLDNLLVKLTLRTIGESLLPDDDASSDADRFWKELYGHISADYAAARPALLKVTPEAR